MPFKGVSLVKSGAWSLVFNSALGKVANSELSE